jgi:hypothetical protein
MKVGFMIVGMNKSAIANLCQMKFYYENDYHKLGRSTNAFEN